MKCITVVMMLVLTGLALSVAADDRAIPGEIANTFQQEITEKLEAAKARDQTVIAGDGGWLFLATELRHITVAVRPFWGERAAEVSRSARAEWADPLPVIVDFHKQLEALGVDLIVVPVPPKAMIYPEKLATTTGPGGRLDRTYQQFYTLLREEGVQVMDMTAEFRARKGDAEAALQYCRTDTHWATPAMVRTAEGLAEQLRQRDWFKAMPTETFAEETREVTINGELRQMLGDEAADRETLALKFIGQRVNDAIEPITPDEDSPILLLGDSHLLVFNAGGDMHAKGAGLADHLALSTGIVPEVIAVRGSGATPARLNLVRKAHRDPAWLKNKKVVIWVFTAREFTETTGWRPLPLTR